MIDFLGPTTFACVGDVHGQMNAMIELIREAEAGAGRAIDFVLQVGDFEPHRHELDLESMAAPSKYRRLGEFKDLLSGALQLPWPLYFIGGNHEPYGFLDQHPEGLELCPNCHYLGRSFAGELHGVRVCALSGIYNEKRFAEAAPRMERINRFSNKEFSCFREPHVERLLDEISADVLILHEWPNGVAAEKDAAEFKRQRRSLRRRALGNPFAELLIEHLLPSLVIAGHVHRSYRSTIRVGTRELRFAGLAKVGSAPGAVAVFEIQGNAIRELGELGEG